MIFFSIIKILPFFIQVKKSLPIGNVLSTYYNFLDRNGNSTFPIKKIPIIFFFFFLTSEP